MYFIFIIIKRPISDCLVLSKIFNKFDLLTFIEEIKILSIKIMTNTLLWNIKHRGKYE
jgi:hypothetical protein